jgi:glycosyltransferase involved in cell wall biosynthesis
VIIDDASKDKSVEVIKQFMAAHAELPIKLLINQKNQGFGSNYAEAGFHGRGKYYRVICGDDEERLESLIAALRQLGKADIILTYLDDARARSFRRRFVSSTYTFLVNLIGGHHLHYYNGLPIVPRKIVLRWHSHAHGFGFQADLIVRLLDMGATYIEVPVIASQRASGKTKAFTFRNIASVGHTLVQLFFRRMSRVLYPKYVPNIANAPQEFATAGFNTAMKLENDPLTTPAVQTSTSQS